MHARGRFRRFALVMVAILAAQALSGCLDNPFGKKGDGDEKDTRTIGFNVPGLEGPPEDGSEGGCEGCIPLERPEGAPPIPTAPPIEEAPRSVSVPYPNDHDVFDVGRTRELQRHGATPFTPAREGTVDWTFTAYATKENEIFGLFGAYGHGDGMLFRATPPYVLDEREGTWDILVTLDPRVVALVEAQEVVTDPHRSAIEDRGGVLLRHHEHPTALTFFEFGSHLWGRTLRVGETFDEAWRPEGTYRDPSSLGFVYTVERIRGGLAEVAVTVLWPDGSEKSWTLTMSPDSPYPLSFRERDRFEAVTTPVQAGGASDMTVRLRERGGTAVDWARSERRSTWTADDADSTYRLRTGAGPLLASEPVYPLTNAIEDIRRGDAATRDFLASKNGPVLVFAALEPEWTRTLPPLPSLDAPIGAIRWSLVWADQDGEILGRVVRRAYMADGSTVPVGYPVEDHVDPRASERAAELGFGPAQDLELLAGYAALEQLREQGTDGVLDWALWRLDLDPWHRAVGTLSLGHLDAPGGWSDEPLDEGVATMDLASGEIVSFATRTG